MVLPMYEENSASPAKMTDVTLNCIVKEKPEAVFQVSINRNASIDKFKEAIKEKLPSTFGNIDTIGIQVWFVQIAQNDTQLERLTYDIRPVGTVLGTTPSYEATRATSSVESQLAYIN